jgi:hypothetical protein
MTEGQRLTRQNQKILWFFNDNENRKVGRWSFLHK